MARASSQRKQIETPSPTFPWGTHESCPSLRNSCSIRAASPSSSQHQRSLPSSIHFFVISKPRPSTYQRTDSSMFDTPKNGTACLTFVLAFGSRFIIAARTSVLLTVNVAQASTDQTCPQNTSLKESNSKSRRRVGAPARHRRTLDLLRRT